MSLPVFFEPNIDLDSFKSLLIENGYAERIVYYENGETETIPWTINRLDPTSNLLANIYSYHRFRNWESKGIEKVIIKTAPHSYKNNKIDVEQSNKEPNLTDNDLEYLIRFAVKLKILSSRNSDNFSNALTKCLSWYSKPKKNATDYYAKALRKIKKWAYSPNQDNHKVIKAYFLAYDEIDSPPSKDRMLQLCSNPNNTDMCVKNFQSTYASLKADGVTTNGKVFEDDGYHVDIWEVVKDELLKYKDFFLGNKTFSHSSSYDSLNTDSFYDEDEVDDDESFINDILYNNKDDDF